MKKRSKLYAFILSVALLGGLAVVASQNQNIYKGVIYANEDEDCSVFYNDSSYTSLYEINNALVGGTTGVAYQTWGTVAGSYLTSSAAKYLYVQSTDKNGNVGCTNIYNVSNTYAVGNVLKISGTPLMYNGMPEFVTPTIEVLYASTSYPITAQETTSDFWKNGTDKTSTQFQYAYKLGPKKVNLSNVTVTYSSSGNGVATFSDTTTVPLYWGSQSNTTEIDTIMTKVSGGTGSITGYVTTFVNGTTAKMQLLLREEEDISVSGNLAITQSNFSWYGTSFYNTGNYGRGTLGALSFDYYRAIKPTGSELMTLLAYQNGEASNNCLPGSFENSSPLSYIKSFSITYSTASSSGAKGKVYFGDTYVKDSSDTTYELDNSTSSKTFTVEFNYIYSYFRVETGASNLTIENIEVDYFSATGSVAKVIGTLSDTVRINPVVYTGTLTDGVYVDVPTSIVAGETTYTVSTTKRYTYYTFSYISGHTDLASAAAWTEPEDVAAYFTAFKTFPANYVYNNGSAYDTAKAIFGSATRCVFYYTRTDGYVTKVPDKLVDGTPSYYEMDIAMEGADYSASNRGIGRVIGWAYGFDADHYSSDPVCTYTDDHYVTFEEYNNYGSFNTRFNGIDYGVDTRVENNWGNGTTLAKEGDTSVTITVNLGTALISDANLFIKGSFNNLSTSEAMTKESDLVYKYDAYVTVGSEYTFDISGGFDKYDSSYASSSNTYSFTYTSGMDLSFDASLILQPSLISCTIALDNEVAVETGSGVALVSSSLTGGAAMMTYSSPLYTLTVDLHSNAKYSFYFAQATSISDISETKIVNDTSSENFVYTVPASSSTSLITKYYSTSWEAGNGYHATDIKTASTTSLVSGSRTFKASTMLQGTVIEYNTTGVLLEDETGAYINIYGGVSVTSTSNPLQVGDYIVAYGELYVYSNRMVSLSVLSSGTEAVTGAFVEICQHGTSYTHTATTKTGSDLNDYLLAYQGTDYNTFIAEDNYVDITATITIGTYYSLTVTGYTEGYGSLTILGLTDLEKTLFTSGNTYTIRCYLGDITTGRNVSDHTKGYLYVYFVSIVSA